VRHRVRCVPIIRHGYHCDFSQDTRPVSRHMGVGVADADALLPRKNEFRVGAT
jgi:hypothetical protein